jgi:hypothetical protein
MTVTFVGTSKREKLKVASIVKDDFTFLKLSNNGYTDF